MSSHLPPSATHLKRGQFVRYCYKLGQTQSTGVLSLSLQSNKAELLILRRGHVFTRDSDALGRETRARLERISSGSCDAIFDSGLAAYPPSLGRPFSLVDWARQHLEGQLSSASAQKLAGELAGARLRIKSEFLPTNLDASDKRIVAAMQTPRRLDQIWPLARTPRFRLMCFVHFLRSIGALHESGVAVDYSAVGERGQLADAMRTLGLRGRVDALDAQEVKRAYRRLARVLHPDLNEQESIVTKRQHQRRMAEVNSAYRELMNLAL